jgi:hypothetical protein
MTHALQAKGLDMFLIGFITGAVLTYIATWLEGLYLVRTLTEQQDEVSFEPDDWDELYP